MTFPGDGDTVVNNFGDPYCDSRITPLRPWGRG
jgi:hypothetical protein